MEVLARKIPHLHAVDRQLAMPPMQFTRLTLREARPDFDPVHARGGVQADRRIDPQPFQGAKPVSADEFAFRQERESFALKCRHHRFPQGDAVSSRSAAPMGQHCPGQRKTEGLPHHAEDQQVEIALPPLLVRAVKDQHQFVVIAERAQHEAGDQHPLIRPVELDAAFQTLIDGLVGSNETDADHQLKQTHRALLDDR